MPLKSQILGFNMLQIPLRLWSLASAWQLKIQGSSPREGKLISYQTKNSEPFGILHGQPGTWKMSPAHIGWGKNSRCSGWKVTNSSAFALKIKRSSWFSHRSMRELRSLPEVIHRICPSYSHTSHTLRSRSSTLKSFFKFPMNVKSGTPNWHGGSAQPRCHLHAWSVRILSVGLPPVYVLHKGTALSQAQHRNVYRQGLQPSPSISNLNARKNYSTCMEPE